MAFPSQMPSFEEVQPTSHVFLAIAADQALVEYCKNILKRAVSMSAIPEIKSLEDDRCIWPHTVHLTIHSFGKVLNSDIPRIADYCKQNINVIDPFEINIDGLFHHEKLHTLGFKVEKATVESLRNMKTNMMKWFNKGINWEGFNPIFSVLRTQTHRGGRPPLSRSSIDAFIQEFGNVQYTQRIEPSKDIQLCLARSSTETAFYKNLLVDDDGPTEQSNPAAN